jgi:hypothetical protein
VKLAPRPNPPGLFHKPTRNVTAEQRIRGPTAPPACACGHRTGWPSGPAAMGFQDRPGSTGKDRPYQPRRECDLSGLSGVNARRLPLALLNPKADIRQRLPEPGKLFGCLPYDPWAEPRRAAACHWPARPTQPEHDSVARRDEARRPRSISGGCRSWHLRDRRRSD